VFYVEFLLIFSCSRAILGVAEKNFGPNEKYLIQRWRKQRSDVLHNLINNNIVKEIKSKKTRWARNITRKGETKIAQSFSHQNIRGQPPGKASNDRIKITKRTLEK